MSLTMDPRASRSFRSTILFCVTRLTRGVVQEAGHLLRLAAYDVERALRHLTMSPPRVRRRKAPSP